LLFSLAQWLDQGLLWSSLNFASFERNPLVKLQTEYYSTIFCSYFLKIRFNFTKKIKFSPFHLVSKILNKSTLKNLENITCNFYQTAQRESLEGTSKNCFEKWQFADEILFYFCFYFSRPFQCLRPFSTCLSGPRSFCRNEKRPKVSSRIILKQIKN
jgi:hypothetical protein